MGFYLKKVGNIYNVPTKYFECDEEADRLALDTTYLESGTRIYVINANKKYVLNGSKTWVEVAETDLSGKLDKSGGTMTGDLYIQNPNGPSFMQVGIKQTGSTDEDNTVQLKDGTLIVRAHIEEDQNQDTPIERNPLNIFTNGNGQGLLLKRGETSTNTYTKIYPYNSGAVIRSYAYDQTSEDFVGKELLDLQYNKIVFGVPVPQLPILNSDNYGARIVGYKASGYNLGGILIKALAPADDPLTGGAEVVDISKTRVVFSKPVRVPNLTSGSGGTEAANKNYVDTAISVMFPKTGGRIDGRLVIVYDDDSDVPRQLELSNNEASGRVMFYADTDGLKISQIDPAEYEIRKDVCIYGVNTPVNAIGSTVTSKTYVDTADALKQNKQVAVTEDAPSAITLADNNIYYLTSVTALTFTYPADTHYECLIDLTTASSGTINIAFPVSSSFIGVQPTFGNSERWEISIRDGIVAAAKVG